VGSTVSEGEVRKVGMYRISRREFLRLGGTGLAEAALLGAAGCGGGGDWPAQFAATGWILDLSDRFTSSMQQAYLEGPREAVEYQGKV
jgi:hypothetical protein